MGRFSILSGTRSRWAGAAILTILSALRYGGWGIAGGTHGYGLGFPWLFIRVVEGTDLIGVVSDSVRVFGHVLGAIGFVGDLFFWYGIITLVRFVLIRQTMDKRTLPVLSVVLLSAVGLFYWFSVRPARAVQSCRAASREYCDNLRESIGVSEDGLYHDDRIATCYQRTQWDMDVMCLQQSGIPKLLTDSHASCMYGWNDCYFFYDLPVWTLVYLPYLLTRFPGR